MFNVLVVEDEHELNKTLCEFLSCNGYHVTGCEDSTEVFSILYDGHIDVIISDIMMPGVDGFELAKNIRLYDKNIPILFLTVKEDFASKQHAYSLGVDDYMTKPFDLEELLLKVKALLRRSGLAASNEIKIGDTVLNKEELSAVVNGEEIKMTVREFDIIFKMLSFPRKIFTRAQLVNDFWDITCETNPRVVDVYITKLREKFADCKDFEIQTVHGLGYKVVLK